MARNGLFDFLQAASNEAASGVSVPVDVLAWAMRKAGIPVGEAVGGSDWMARKGLIKEVPQSAASLAGSTVGLLSPVAAAAKGPQIAQGLLKAGDNLAAPRTLNPQRGAIDTEALRKAFPSVDFSLMQSGDVATLSKVQVPKGAREQGTGTAFMKALADAADADKARLALSPSADFGGNKARLVEFYKRFGFKKNKGKDIDFTVSESMIREPR